MRTLTRLAVIVALAASGGGTLTAQTTTSGPVMEVYKTATCGCCGKWVEHMKAAGFTTRWRPRRAGGTAAVIMTAAADAATATAISSAGTIRRISTATAASTPTSSTTGGTSGRGGPIRAGWAATVAIVSGGVEDPGAAAGEYWQGAQELSYCRFT